MGLQDEPLQQPNSQHIVADTRSKAWLEVKESNVNYQARAVETITWVTFSALFLKLVRYIAALAPLSCVALGLLIVLTPLLLLAHRRWQANERFTVFAYVGLVILGFVLGGVL